MSSSIVAEYIELRERATVEALFAEEGEASLYARLEQLWLPEMSPADREEAQGRLAAKAQAWRGTTQAVGPINRRKEDL